MRIKSIKLISLLITITMLFSLNLTVFSENESNIELPPEIPSNDSIDNSNVERPELPDGVTPKYDKPEDKLNDDLVYSSLYEYSQDAEIIGQNIISENADENAILINSGEIVVSKTAINRTSSDSTGGDNASFYGIGATYLQKGGNSYISNSGITSDSKGAAGLFSYGEGTIYAKNVEIQTKQDTSGGIHVAGNGKIYAWNVNAQTEGDSSAAIRSDRGGGTIIADTCNFGTKGIGSPAVYSTADITVNNSELTAYNSEAVCIEGNNSLKLYDTQVSGFMKDDDQNDCTWTVIIYQSMSGDSEEGLGTFAMKDGSINSENGGLFYTTNTESQIYLENVEITPSQESPFLLRCTGNNNKRGWGKSGENGADCTFTARNQKLEGNIIFDNISNLNYYLLENSNFNGTFIEDEKFSAEDGNGKVNVYLGVDSTWTVTSDCTISNLVNLGNIVDAEGKKVSIKLANAEIQDEYVVEGESEITITVDTYDDSNSFSGYYVMPEYEAIKMQEPEMLEYKEPETETSKQEISEEVQSKIFEYKYYILVLITAMLTLLIVSVIVLINKKKNKKKKL